MAERRMFAKTIIDSDAFLDMSVTARLLYYDLSMRADDDGFVNSPKKIMRIVGASEDDLRCLIARKFIIPFEIGVVVIKHWRIHNYIRKDTYNETPYKEQKSLLELDENNAYRSIADNSSTELTRAVDEPRTQDRLGKDRLGKVNKRESSSDASCPSPKTDYEEIRELYNNLCPSYPKCVRLSDSRKKAIKARLSSGYTVEDFKKVFQMAEESEFLKGGNSRNWRATFDWILKDGNMVKILDGNYESKNKKLPQGAKGHLGSAELDAIRQLMEE